MIKLASKFAMDIFPSVIATVVGAYIVNHYINAKAPGGDVPAAAVSSADPKKAISRTDSRPAEKSADLGNLPEPGVRAKGVLEKLIGGDKGGAEKATGEKPAEKANGEKPSEKADKPSETASIPPVTPAEKGRRPTPPREKTTSEKTNTEKTVSKTPPMAAPAAEPVAVVAAPPAEPAATPDANDLARAAIERLRGNDPAPRAPESARVSEPPKTAEPARTAAVPAAATLAPPPVPAAPSLQPLPPPIMVSTPQQMADPKPPVARVDDPTRPVPPADIPESHAPLDLRADAVEQQQPAKRPSVADDVFSATKKLFNSVIPKPQSQQQ